MIRDTAFKEKRHQLEQCCSLNSLAQFFLHRPALCACGGEYQQTGKGTDAGAKWSVKCHVMQTFSSCCFNESSSVWIYPAAANCLNWEWPTSARCFVVLAEQLANLRKQKGEREEGEGHEGTNELYKEKTLDSQTDLIGVISIWFN